MRPRIGSLRLRYDSMMSGNTSDFASAREVRESSAESAAWRSSGRRASARASSSEWVFSRRPGSRSSGAPRGSAAERPIKALSAALASSLSSSTTTPMFNSFVSST